MQTKGTMEREYFYTIDTRGNLIHDDTIIDDGGFIDYFYHKLQPNQSGQQVEYPYLSVCGREKNYAVAQDTPIVFHHLNDGYLLYADTLKVEFSREKLRYSHDGILYHEAPIGGFGRILPQVAMEISKNIQPFGEYYSYHDSNDKFPWIIEPTQLPEYIKILRPRAGNYCAGCGQESPNGLFLSFVFDAHAVTIDSWLTPDKRLEGALGIMHGGYVSLLLDEAMGKVLSGMGIKAPTGNLNVRFRKPTPLGATLQLHAQFIENQGRKYFLKGELRDAGGIVLAEAEGLFIAIKA